MCVQLLGITPDPAAQQCDHRTGPVEIFLGKVTVPTLSSSASNHSGLWLPCYASTSVQD
jgi:hypothetical protein